MAQPIAKRRQFQQRNVERAAVEADQRRPAIVFPAAPEMLGDHVRPKLRLVEHHQVEQPKIGGDLADRHRDRNLERVGDEVAVVLRQQLVPIAAHGRRGVEFFARIAQPRDQRAVGDAFDVERQITNGRLSHRRVLVLDGSWSEPASDQHGAQPTKTARAPAKMSRPSVRRCRPHV